MPSSKEKQREYARKHYLANKSKFIDRRRAQQAKARKEIDELKSVPCKDCGGLFPPYVMDFDHRDPKQKSFGIARSYSKGVKSLLKEIEKCDVVCANCHRIRTHAPIGYAVDPRPLKAANRMQVPVGVPTMPGKSIPFAAPRDVTG